MAEPSAPRQHNHHLLRTGCRALDAIEAVRCRLPQPPPRDSLSVTEEPSSWGPAADEMGRWPCGEDAALLDQLEATCAAMLRKRQRYPKPSRVESVVDRLGELQDAQKAVVRVADGAAVQPRRKRLTEAQRLLLDVNDGVRDEAYWEGGSAASSPTWADQSEAATSRRQEAADAMTRGDFDTVLAASEADLARWERRNAEAGADRSSGFVDSAPRRRAAGAECPADLFFYGPRGAAPRDDVNARRTVMVEPSSETVAALALLPPAVKEAALLGMRLAAHPP